MAGFFDYGGDEITHLEEELARRKLEEPNNFSGIMDMQAQVDNEKNEAAKAAEEKRIREQREAEERNAAKRAEEARAAAEKAAIVQNLKAAKEYKLNTSIEGQQNSLNEERKRLVTESGNPEAIRMIDEEISGLDQPKRVKQNTEDIYNASVLRRENENADAAQKKGL